MTTNSTQTTLRSAARKLVSTGTCQAAANQHARNYHKLHISRTGALVWTETVNQSDDLIDDQADGFAAIPSVICAGTGSYACNCDYCGCPEYPTIADAVADAVASSDLGDLEEQMLREFDAIPDGYFADETR